MTDTTSAAGALRRSPLHDRHVALGATTADFGGWDMPIDYAGTLAEHAAVRQRVGLFDVSHMGKVTVSGTGAVDALNALLTNDLGRIGAGQAQYTMLCDDDGGVVDDLIVYRKADDEVFLVPNAANADAVVAAVSAALPAGLVLTDQHEDLAIIAVQGPRSASLLDAMGLPTGHDYMTFVTADWDDVTVVVCRTGYTGEHGYELVVPWGAAARVWDDLLTLGRPFGVAPAGLGARDTLRTEMGYPLHGQDLSRSITPVQARLGWAVGWSKPVFSGRAALVAERSNGPARLLRGLRALDRGIPRPHMAVRASAAVDADALSGPVVGEVTSGTFSPTLREGIALALLAPDIADGAEVVVDVRGRAARFVVVRPPFVDPSTR